MTLQNLLLLGILIGLCVLIGQTIVWNKKTAGLKTDVYDLGEHVVEQMSAIGNEYEKHTDRLMKNTTQAVDEFHASMQTSLRLTEDLQEIVNDHEARIRALEKKNGLP